MFRGNRQRSAAVIAAFSLFVSFLAVSAPAQASVLANGPLIGTGLKTTLASQYALRLAYGNGSFPFNEGNLGLNLSQPSSGLDTELGAQVVMPSGIRYQVDLSQDVSTISFPVLPKTVHPGGIVNSDLTLTKANSPYKFESTLEIASGNKLTVEAGAILEFANASGAAIWTNGDVLIQGTSSDPVKISGPKSYASIFRMTGASQITVEIQHAEVFGFVQYGGGRNSLFQGGDWGDNTVILENSKLFDLSHLGYFYSFEELRFSSNYFVNSGLAAIFNTFPYAITDNTYLGDTLLQMELRNPNGTVVGNDFSQLGEDVLKIYEQVNLQGNYWGTTLTSEIKAKILDGLDSLEYGSGVADITLPLLEASIDSPRSAGYASFPTYLTGPLHSLGYPALVLTPSSSNVNPFNVSVTTFLDLDLSGAVTAGETQSLPITVDFIGFSQQSLGTTFSVSGEYLGTNIWGSVSFSQDLNTAQMSTIGFKVQRFEPAVGSWTDFLTLTGSAASLNYFNKTVSPITEDIYLRLVAGNSYFQIASAAIDDNEGTTITISAPATATPGTTYQVQVLLQDENQNPVRISGEDVARLTLSMNGPGLLIGNNRLYTNSNGVAYVNILFGSNDTGILELTFTLDPDGDLGTRNVVSQTLRVFVGTIGDVVQDADSGEIYVTKNGVKHLIPDSFPLVQSAVGVPTPLPSSLLAEYATGHPFSGILRLSVFGEHFLTDESSLELIDDCFLAAQFDLHCSLAVEVKPGVISALESGLGVSEIATKTYPSLGTLLTPTVEIQGTPGLGKNLSARITGAQLGAFASLKWIRLVSPEQVLREDRVTYTVQQADVGHQIAFEITLAKPNYATKTVRSNAVSALFNSAPIPWTPPSGPVVVDPPIGEPPTPTPAVSGTEIFSSWTKKIDIWSAAKVYAKNPVGKGKIQFFFNGQEIAWVRAASELDPKLRIANDSAYLVRTVYLQPGKNVIEIYVDGVRTTRTSYTR